MKKIFIPLIIATILQLLPQIACSQETDNDFVYPNQPQIDSLLNATNSNSPDSVKAMNYYKVSNLTCDNDTRIKYALLSLEYCKSTDMRLLSDNYSNLAYAYYMKDESRTALKYRFKAANIFHERSDKQNEAITFLHIGNCYLDLNIKDSIFYYYNKAIVYFTETRDTNLLIPSYNNLGQIYSNMSLYANAEENHRKALDYSLATNDTLQMAHCYCYLGIAIGNQSDSLINQAIRYLSKSIRLFESKVAARHRIVEEKHNAYMLLADTYIKAAKLTGKKEYADSCYMFLKKVGNYYQTVGSNYSYVHYQYSYADYLIFCKRYNEALTVLLGIGKYLTDNSTAFAFDDYHRYLYEVYSKLGDYKNALKHHEKYMEYKMAHVNDSTLNSIKNSEVERTRMLDSVNHQYETLRIEVEHQQELARTRIRTRVMLSVALLLIIIGVILFFFYKTAKENEENKLRNKALEIERSLLRTQMNPHFIFNALNSVQSFIVGNNTQEAVRFLSKFAKLMRMILNNSMVQSVTLSNEMQSLSLYLDLERARFGNKFNYRIDIDDNVEEDLVSIPPMLVQPFIENAIIHGLMHKAEGEGLISIKITEMTTTALLAKLPTMVWDERLPPNSRRTTNANTNR